MLVHVEDHRLYVEDVLTARLRREVTMTPIRRYALGALLVLGSALGPAQPARARDCTPVAVQDRWFVPNYAKLQTGGYLGFVTFGTGLSLARSRLELELLYGWVPESVGGTPIHNITLRSLGRSRTLCFARGWQWTYLFGGPSVLFALGDQYFLRVPERYHDRRYYRRTAMHWTLALGTEVTLPWSDPRKLAQHGFFLETAALDDYVLLWFQNVGAVPFTSMFSSSAGYRVRF